jgi:hypothetical protein
VRLPIAKLVLAGVLALAGCDTPQQPPNNGYWVDTEGTVRFVRYGDARNCSNVVIEASNGRVFTVALLDPTPPVWQGLRGIFAYESAGNAGNNGIWKNFIVLKRLPDVVPEVHK